MAEIARKSVSRIGLCKANRKDTSTTAHNDQNNKDLHEISSQHPSALETTKKPNYTPPRGPELITSYMVVVIADDDAGAGDVDDNVDHEVDDYDDDVDVDDDVDDDVGAAKKNKIITLRRKDRSQSYIMHA